jgi:hypothetical protein
MEGMEMHGGILTLMDSCFRRNAFVVLKGAEKAFLKI